MNVAPERDTFNNWGCPKCHGTESKVRFIEYDADGVPVRLRHCSTPGCDGRWATEERLLNGDIFWQRADSRQVARRARTRREIHLCRFCGGSYRGGHYRRHCAQSPRHLAAIKPADRDIHKKRAYQREWMRRRREEERGAAA